MMGIKPVFWLVNVQEACERLAYFGIRAILPLVMVSSGPGGFGLDMTDKGIIFGVWALIQCLVPMVSGGFSESFGYKKSLIVAFIINILGYLLMANIPEASSLIMGTDNVAALRTCNFWMMMLSGCTIGLGTAIFKPPVQGMVAKSLNKKNSGFGFGLFYWVVNIGGVVAPMLAAWLRGTDEAPTWHYVFYGAAFVTAFNMLVTILLFKEPKRTRKELKEHKNESPLQVLKKTMKTLIDDSSMLIFLLIVSGFWLMFMQLWDLMPNFIDEWVDSRSIGTWLAQYEGWQSFVLPDGSIKPEMVINIDAAAIIIFVLPLSWVFSKFKMMTSLVLGMIVATVGFIMAGVTTAGAIVCLGVFVFAIGEIICSPKFSEYIGMTAPADKKAIYMGFSNIPFAVGWAFGNFLSGPLYQGMSSKETLAKKFLVDHGFNADTVAQMDASQALAAVQQNQHLSDIWQVNDVLWQAYQPWLIWIVLGAIGVVSMVGMIVFYSRSDMKDSDAKEKEELPADLAETSEGAQQIIDWSKTGDLDRFMNLRKFVKMAELQKLFESDDSETIRTVAKFIDHVETGVIAKFNAWVESDEMKAFIEWYDHEDKSEESEDSEKSENSDSFIYPDPSEDFSKFLAWHSNLASYIELAEDGLEKFFKTDKADDVLIFIGLSKSDNVKKFMEYTDSWGAKAHAGIEEDDRFSLNINKYRKDVISDPEKGLTTDDVENITIKD